MASSDARIFPIKNTAYRVTFPILDADGDLVTGATGLDSEVSKDGGTFSDCTNEATEIATSSGIYYLDLTSTEMNADTVAVIVKTSSSGAKTTVLVFYPVETGDIDVDVTAYGGTAGTFSGGRPEVNTTHIAGSAVNTSSAQIGVNVVNAAGTAWASGAITAAAIADGAIDRATFAADTGLQTVRSNTAQAGASTTITLDASASGTDDYYNNSLIYLTGGTGVGQARFITDYVGSSKVATVNSAWATNPDNTTTFAVIPFDSIPGATAPTAAAVADAVWDEARSGHVAAGSFGERVLADTTYWNGSAVATPTTAGVPEVDLTHWLGTAPNALVNGRPGVNLQRIDDNATASDNLRDFALAMVPGTAITGTLTTTAFTTSLTEATDDHYKEASISFRSGALAGQSRIVSSYNGTTKTITVDEAFTDAPSNTDAFVITPQHAHLIGAIADAVLDEPTAGHTTAGTAGKALTDILEDTGTTLQAEVDGIQADTEDIQSRIPAALTAGGHMKSDALAISGDTTAADNLEAACDGNTYNVGGGAVVAASVTGNVGGNVTGSVGSLATQAKSDVNAEVLDVLNTDTFAEPGQEAPGATVSLVKKIGYLYKFLRNKITQTATDLKIYADDGTTVDQKATVSDDATTYTRGEIGTGP
jgi:hypothetical protein